VYVSSAQQMLQQGDETGARKQLADADKCRADSRAAFEEAQALSWRSNNTRSNCWEIDLHGLSPPRALDKFVQQLAVLQMMDHPGGVLFRVIVGQGHHSENNVPKIKLGVLQYLQEQGQRVLEDQGGVPWGVSWQVDPSNPGVINVHIPQHQQEAEQGGGER
jgi:hypothetical protein